MTSTVAHDPFAAWSDGGRAARAWLAFHEGALFKSSPELAVRQIHAVGLQVRVVRYDESATEDERHDRVTLHLAADGSVGFATAS